MSALPLSVYTSNRFPSVRVFTIPYAVRLNPRERGSIRLRARARRAPLRGPPGQRHRRHSLTAALGERESRPRRRVRRLRRNRQRRMGPVLWSVEAGTVSPASPPRGGCAWSARSKARAGVSDVPGLLCQRCPGPFSFEATVATCRTRHASRSRTRSPHLHPAPRAPDTPGQPEPSRSRASYGRACTEGASRRGLGGKGDRPPGRGAEPAPEARQRPSGTEPSCGTSETVGLEGPGSACPMLFHCLIG